MKKIISFLLILCSLPWMNVAGAAAYDISAHSAVVYEPLTGTFLYEKAPDERMLVASTTKIMTALIVLENCALDDTVVATAQQAAVEGSSMYLKAGESYTVEELLHGLLLASGNDAAMALAEHCAGSIEAFAALMNEKCAELGLENSHFENPHGLDGKEHYSSARDLALITAAAMENQDFCRIFSTRSYQTKGLSYVNHNKLLTTCQGCIGGKTGYTEAAGRVLVSCVEREGMRLVCVTISDPRDWEDHRQLYNEMYEKYRLISLPLGDWSSLPIVSGAYSSAGLKCSPCGVVAKKSSTVEIKAELPRYAFAPVFKDAVAGKVDIYVDGSLALCADILYSETVLQDGSQLLTAKERFMRDWYRAMQYSAYFPYH